MLLLEEGVDLTRNTRKCFCGTLSPAFSVYRKITLTIFHLPKSGRTSLSLCIPQTGATKPGGRRRLDKRGRGVDQKFFSMGWKSRSKQEIVRSYPTFGTDGSTTLGWELPRRRSLASRSAYAKKF
ncbi:hypothetical protein NPIL_72381 [Nephila pilipes]|uniref:Uncharacterized protein n=1 Tax=Nephila pilipes TaxID=299642 RepID=A0A8X6NHF6_NEPPI|nr:hypothetical protein NPIL_72381 [Nephila pilipes]